MLQAEACNTDTTNTDNCMVFINRIFIFMPLEWSKIRRHKEMQVIVTFLGASFGQ